MKCPKCGNDVLSTDSHCGACGVHLATAFKEKSASKPSSAPKKQTTGKVCPKCGHPVQNTDLTCGYCTHYLGSNPQYRPTPTPSTPKPSIKDNTFYNIFLYLPIIFAILTVIAGIVLAIALELGWIALVGIAAGPIIWFFFKVALSPVVAQIDYLDAIEKNTRKK